MKKILFITMIAVMLGYTPYSMAESTSRVETSSTFQMMADPPIHPATGLAYLPVAMNGFDTMQTFDPICRADCREDFHACTMSSPLSLCRSLYNQCIAAC